MSHCPRRPKLPSPLSLCIIGVAFLGLLPACARAGSSGDTLNKIRDHGEITFGYRETSVPFAYLDADGSPIGYHVDLCRRVAQQVAQRLQMPKLVVRFAPVSPSNHIPLLQNGTIDLECGQTTNTVERQRQVAFSVTTFVTDVGGVVRKDSGLTKLAQLQGKTVSVNAGATAVDLIHKYEREHKASIHLNFGADGTENFTLMANRRVAANVGDTVILAGQVATSRHPEEFRSLDDSLRSEPYALMLRKDDPEFKALVDATLTAIMRSGDIHGLYAKWFTSPIPPRGVNLRFEQTQAIRNAFAHPNDRGV